MKRPILLLSLIASLSVQAQSFSWIAQESGTSQLLIDVFFLDDQEGWVVGNGGTILHTSDGGLTWEPQTSGTNQVLRAVQFLSSSKGWAAGGQMMKTLLRTTDGGMTWIPSADGINTNQVRDIVFTSADHGWAITPDSIYVTDDAGMTWIVENYDVDLGANLSHRAITATSDTSAYIATRFDHTAAPPAAVLDNQTSLAQKWSADEGSDFVTEDQLRVICFSNERTGFAGGEKGVIYKMAGDGVVYNGPWLNNFDSGSNDLIRGITFPDAATGSFCTSTVLDTVTYALIYFTADTGGTWSVPDSIMGMDIRGLHAPDTETAWAVGSTGQIYKGARIQTTVNTVAQVSGINVFPSPFSNALTFVPELGQRIVRAFELLDATGKRILRTPLNSSTAIRIDGLEPLGSGIYFVRTLDEAGRTIGTQRVVKQ